MYFYAETLALFHILVYDHRLHWHGVAGLGRAATAVSTRGRRNSGERRDDPKHPLRKLRRREENQPRRLEFLLSLTMESSLSSASTPHRKLLRSLVHLAVQRCRMSESPCRLTVSVKRPAEPASPSQLRVSVSDTGMGSKLEEFQELNVLARETPVEKWVSNDTIKFSPHFKFQLQWHSLNHNYRKAIDDFLHIPILGINDDAIYRYRFNLQEEISSARFTKLATTYKSHAQFSGTEVCLCLSNEADADDFIMWLVGFFHKILVLRAAVSISELLSFLKPDLLKTGIGAANNAQRRKAKGLHVEVVLMIAREASDLSCWTVNCPSTQVLYFEDFVPCPISQSSFDVLVSIDWQSYGFKLKGGYIDDEGNAVLEWDNISFARVDIAIHTYLE
nr:unnamed protein product [Digitaria exilis]